MIFAGLGSPSTASRAPLAATMVAGCRDLLLQAHHPVFQGQVGFLQGLAQTALLFAGDDETLCDQVMGAVGPNGHALGALRRDDFLAVWRPACVIASPC
jgi:hypothetical protein